MPILSAKALAILAKGSAQKSCLFRVEDTKGRKETVQQLDLEKLTSPLKHPQNTSDTWEDGAGALSSPTQSPEDQSVTDSSEPDFPQANFLVNWAVSHVLLVGVRGSVKC